jgi:hypothetical protein
MQSYSENEPHAEQTATGRNAVVVDDTALPLALKKIELRALRQMADSQICRLLQLANLQDVPNPVDRPANLLTELAEDIREATTVLEESLQGIADLHKQ